MKIASDVPDDLPAVAVSWLLCRKVTAATLRALVIEMLQRGLIELTVERNRYTTDGYQYKFYLRRLVDESQIREQPIWEQRFLRQLSMTPAQLSDIGWESMTQNLVIHISHHLYQKGYEKHDGYQGDTVFGIAFTIIVVIIFAVVFAISWMALFLFSIFFIVGMIGGNLPIPLPIAAIIVVIGWYLYHILTSSYTYLGRKRIQQWTTFRDNFHQWPIEHFDAYLPYAAAFGKRAQWFRRAAAAGIEPPAWLAAIAKESGLPPTMETLEQLFGAFYEQWADTFNFTVHAYEPRR